MTVWFVIPSARETVFRVAYLAEKVRGRDNANEDEKIGKMRPSIDGTKLITGTTRMSDARRQAFAGRKPPWLEIYTSHADLLASGWVYSDSTP